MHPVGIAEGIASEEARRHIDVGPGEAEMVVTRSRALTAVERLAIYGYAYYARLLECLREEFPVLEHALAQEVFDAFAVGYLQAYPSRSYTLFQLGANFPRYLAETRPEDGGSEELPPDWPDFLIDLATLELTFNEVFDGPGSRASAFSMPGNSGPFRPSAAQGATRGRAAVYGCSPCAIPFISTSPRCGATRTRVPPEPAETYLAVTRRNYVVRHYELSPPAYQLLNALLAGESVGAGDRAGSRERPDQISTVWPATCGHGSTTGRPRDSSAPLSLGQSSLP